jgi:dTDP-4-amino-4,6-dideoxygalactose transaminase
VKVPFLDLKAAHAPLLAEINEAIGDVIAASAFAGGPFVEIFEDAFARYCGSPYAVGVSNGTDALTVVLRALDIGPGDEVITVPNSFIATAEAISAVGARPVFVDVDAETYTMDPGALEGARTARTKAVIPVHLFGQPADLDPIWEFAWKHGLSIVEDAAQAHGAKYKGKPVGMLSDAAAFSFYPGKNLGAFGEAGAVITHNAALARKIEILRDHGQLRKYEHAFVGSNYRMDGIQAAVLRVKLRYLDKGNGLRRAAARYYTEHFAGIPDLVTPVAAPYVDSGDRVYHVYALRLRNRDEVARLLAANGIATGIHYPTPIHLTEAYRFLGYREGAFPVAERCAREFLSLPLYPELTEAQLAAVVRAVKEAVTATAGLVPA